MVRVWWGKPKWLTDRQRGAPQGYVNQPILRDVQRATHSQILLLGRGDTPESPPHIHGGNKIKRYQYWAFVGIVSNY